MAPALTSMSEELTQKLDSFRASVAETAEDVVFRVFPQKILDMQAWIEATTSPDSVFHDSHAQDSTDTTVYPEPSENAHPNETKKRKLDDGTAESTTQLSFTTYARLPSQMVANQHLVKVHDAIKKECEDLVQLIDKIKLWINITMPKIEDGDNFGVQIQEEALAELHRSQESAYNLRDTCRQHHLNRAKICSKIMKYPNLEDYKIALKEHDDKQFYLARQHIYDLRAIYAVLTDILHKNISKIRAPKANNGVALY